MSLHQDGSTALAELAMFGEATPELLAARALLTRVDRKFVLAHVLLETLLRQLRDEYRLLRAAGAPLATYQTSYFDTLERQLYQDHRRNRRPRFKVRLRHHLERQLSFLEIKRKDGRALTSKARLERPFGTQDLDIEAHRFIEAHCPLESRLLHPCVTSQFRRITLVGERVEERLTIDCDLAFTSDTRSERLPGIVIVEIKQARRSSRTPAVAALRGLQVQETAISKYCLATARLAGIQPDTAASALLAPQSFSG